MALGDIDRHFAWEAWHLWHLAGSGGALGPCLAPWLPRLFPWRRGTWRHRLSLCMAGVALGDIDRHFAWQGWHLWHWTGSSGALGGVVWRRGRRGCLRDSCSTWRHRPSLCVASVALMALVWVRWHTHTQLFHTTLSQIPFTHNFVTQAFHTHTTLSHTTLSLTTLPHTSLSHTIFYTQLCHTQLFHTQHFYIHKLTHTKLSRTALSPNLSCTISFPSCLSHLIFTSACDHWKKLICGVIWSFNSSMRD